MNFFHVHEHMYLHCIMIGTKMEQRPLPPSCKHGCTSFTVHHAGCDHDLPASQFTMLAVIRRINQQWHVLASGPHRCCSFLPVLHTHHGGIVREKCVQPLLQLRTFLGVRLQHHFC